MMGKRMFRSRKAQSAMEYLMTYGWAILIIAVVLGALFSLGVFSGASLIGNACIAGPGYYCGSMIYSHTSGASQFTVVVGQSTGSSWTAVNVILAPQGVATGSSGGPINTGTTTVLQTSAASPVTLVSGQQATVNLNLGSTVAVGNPLAGSVWACYVTSGAVVTYQPVTTGACSGYLTQIATFTTKAV
jgi:hypothetical protein